MANIVALMWNKSTLFESDSERRRMRWREFWRSVKEFYGQG